MLRFRPPSLPPPGDVADLLAVAQVIEDAMQPGNFLVAPELSLYWIAARSETIAWEIFRGRLLDASQSRVQKTFLSWHVVERAAAPAPEPILSVKLDVHARQIHVARGFLGYAWEGYDAGGGVIESREAKKWQRELVGTITLSDCADLESMRDELICLIWQAIVGTSRLPLTSVEAPLPVYIFGQLHYVHRADAGDEALACGMSLSAGAGPFAADQARSLASGEIVKLVEFVLRQQPAADTDRLAQWLGDRRPPLAPDSAKTLLRRMFNDVSLSPYTQFTDNALAWLDRLTGRGVLRVEEKIDFLGHLLCQLGRHLTAYDLVTFHHRGANYPDALLLDAVLKEYVQALEANPDCFLGSDGPARRRRLGLRQASLMRRHYQGHLVPDAPTSPGENARVMPASHPRVPEEQLLQAQRRRRQLYADEPLLGLLTEKGRLVLGRSVADLADADERMEMGLGVFIDRPLGYAKPPVAPDQTPILAHEAFSRSIAQARWQELKALCQELSLPIHAGPVDGLFERGPWPAGLPHAEIAECPRPAAALCDVRKVADDFVIVRTKPAGLRAMFESEILRDVQRCRLHFANEANLPRLCVQGFDEEGKPALVLYDEELRRRVVIEVDVSQGYRTRAGVEWPRGGLRVLRAWDNGGDAC